jgi:hypothetical protein
MFAEPNQCVFSEAHSACGRPKCVRMANQTKCHVRAALVVDAHGAVETSQIMIGRAVAYQYLQRERYTY